MVDHPPHDVRRGQSLIADVYRTIRSNDALFRSTLLVVVYDEHGGFYDHVSPTPAVPPDAHHEEYTFDRYGVRVPAVLISPWIPAQVVKTELDHTALLRALQKRWRLRNLAARVAHAPDLFASLELSTTLRTDTPPLAAPSAMAQPAAVARRAVEQKRLSPNEEAILAFSAWLDTETPGKPQAKVSAVRKAMQSPADSRQVAKARAVAFLRKRGARL